MRGLAVLVLEAQSSDPRETAATLVVGGARGVAQLEAATGRAGGPL
ncbi:MAG TPA: hypothetical protein VNH82_10745 [Candidatus Dormibacteraeota bacterium]|nr:hypothetical protein [Candidatus Dormibacteraeota bacterium]